MLFLFGGLVSAVLTYYFFKHEVNWVVTILLSTACVGTLFSIAISGLPGEHRHIDVLGPLVIPQVWLVVTAYFVLLWAVIKLLHVEIYVVMP